MERLPDRPDLHEEKLHYTSKKTYPLAFGPPFVTEPIVHAAPDLEKQPLVVRAAYRR